MCMQDLGMNDRVGFYESHVVKTFMVIPSLILMRKVQHLEVSYGRMMCTDVQRKCENSTSSYTVVKYQECL